MISSGSRARTGIANLARASVAFLILAVVSACAVAQSYKVAMAPGEADPGAADRPVNPKCRSEAGSYSLSMTTWSFEIVSFGADPTYFIQEIEEKRYPDSRHTYCLDYVATALADDKLDVGYTATSATSAGGLLSYVASFAVDKTANVIRNVIRAIFIGISRNKDFQITRFGKVDGEPKTHGRFEVDPLDAEEMTALNRRLRDFGFCLVLDRYTVDQSISGEEYCANPDRTLATYPSYELHKERQKSWFVQHAERTGILYRPRIPYWLLIYTQTDPRHSPWELRMSTQVRLENLAPIVSLGLNRAAFADARVGLEFDGGVLENYCLTKSSELRGFIEIPLDIVYGVVQLPAQTLKAELERAVSSPELEQAETELMGAQRKFIEFERTRELRASPSRGNEVRIANRAGGPKYAEGRTPPDEKFAKLGTGEICGKTADKVVRARAAD